MTHLLLERQNLYQRWNNAARSSFGGKCVHCLFGSGSFTVPRISWSVSFLPSYEHVAVELSHTRRGSKAADRQDELIGYRGAEGAFLYASVWGASDQA